MTQQKLSFLKIVAVLKLHAQGLKPRQIARSVGCAHSTVRECLIRACSAGVSWPLPQELDEAALHAQLYRKTLRKTCQVPTYETSRPLPDFATITRELSRKHLTRRQLWREYLVRHPDGLRYTAFCVRLRQWRRTLGAEATLALVHEPGERLFVDYSGDCAHYVDRTTGEQVRAQLFVAAWGFSHKLYAEASATQSSRDWLSSHANAFEFFGCCPAVVVPDNTKAAVIKACFYDPQKSRPYADLGEHYGVTLLPARCRRPRDKAPAEVAVLIVQRRILAALRDAQFFSLAELNVAIRRIVVEINAEAFQKREGSRDSLFEQYERPAARPLPARRYEYAEWRAAVVHPDYHVQVDKGFYSVPYTLIGQKLQVRLSARIVEIFLDGKSIATHPRGERPWQRQTIPAHRPAEHRAYLELDYGRLVERANRIGPSAAAVLCQQVRLRRHLDEAIRGALGILRLAEDFSPQALEQTCAMALKRGGPCSYRALRELLLQSRYTPAKPTLPGTADLAHENVRGSGYFCDETSPDRRIK